MLNVVCCYIQFGFKYKFVLRQKIFLLCAMLGMCLAAPQFGLGFSLPILGLGRTGGYGSNSGYGGKQIDLIWNINMRFVHISYSRRSPNARIWMEFIEITLSKKCIMFESSALTFGCVRNDFRFCIHYNAKI